MGILTLIKTGIPGKSEKEIIPDEKKLLFMNLWSKNLKLLTGEQRIQVENILRDLRNRDAER